MQHFNEVYYEPEILNYQLGKELKEQFKELPWIPIESHNRIPEMQEKSNKEFGRMKRNLIIGIRKTHKYVENHKVSDFWFPIPLPAAAPCACTATWSAITISARICGFLSTGSR